jgi:hypothetical protein
MVLDGYSLSSREQRVLLQALPFPDSDVDIPPVTIKGHWRLRPDLLERDWQRETDCHPVLRSSFQLVDVPEPLRRLHGSVQLRIEHQPAVDEDSLRPFLTADRTRQFDPETSPRTRPTAVETGPDSLRVLWTTGRILVDDPRRPAEERTNAGPGGCRRRARPSIPMPVGRQCRRRSRYGRCSYEFSSWSEASGRGWSVPEPTCCSVSCGPPFECRGGPGRDDAYRESRPVAGMGYGAGMGYCGRVLTGYTGAAVRGPISVGRALHGRWNVARGVRESEELSARGRAVAAAG